MFRVCAYFVNSVSKDDFEQWLEALDCASEICNDGKAISVEIKNPETDEVLRELYPQVR